MRILSLAFLLFFASTSFALDYGYEFYGGIFIPGPVETYLKLRDDTKDRRGLGVGNGLATTTFSGTNRTQHNWVTDTLEGVGANLPRFEVEGVLVEGPAANILLGSPPVTQTLSLGIGTFVLQVEGTGTATPSAGTATITGEAAASDGTPNTFAVTGSGTVVITIATATEVWLTTGSAATAGIVSSYFAGSAAIGADIAVDGGFAAITEAEEGVGVTVIGNCYKILEQNDIDYAATDGAPNNNVGTYWNSTVGGAVIDGGGGDDRLNRCTLTSWTEGTGWAPEASAGALTNKAQKIAGSASNLTQNILTTGIVYQISAAETFSAGEVRISAESSHGTYRAVNDTVWEYLTSNGNTLTIRGNTLFVGTIDDVVVKTHGTSRLTEASATMWTTSDNLHAALQDEGAVVLTWTPGYDEADATVDVGILAVKDQVDSLVYHDVTGNGLASHDGTTEATVAKAFVSGTEYKISVRWPSSFGKYEIGIKDAGVWAWGTAVNFDDSFNPGNNLIIGRDNGGNEHPSHIREIIFYDRSVTQDFIEKNH